MTGLPPEKVKLHTTFAGGGFGRRATPTSHYIVEALEIAKHAKAPLKLIWTREDDLRGGYYRPLWHSRMEAGLDARGEPCAGACWQNTRASSPRSSGPPAPQAGALRFRRDARAAWRFTTPSTPTWLTWRRSLSRTAGRLCFPRLDREELYDLVADPDERAPLRSPDDSAGPLELARSRLKLQQQEAESIRSALGVSERGAAALDEATLSELRRLGYVE